MSLFAVMTPEQFSSLDSMAGIPPCKPCCKSATNIAQLVDNINEIVASAPPEGLGALKPCIIKLLENTELPESEFKQYAFFSNELPYTRNLIATDNKNYTLLLLCWSPGYASKIHDHPTEGCYVKVMKNTIRETRYIVTTEGEVVPYQSIEAGAGAVTFMHDSLGLHKIENPNLKEGSITMHLYTPPYQTCKVWDGEGFNAPKIGKMFHFSHYGLKTPQPTESDLAYYI
eukprot:gene4358-4779_t